MSTNCVYNSLETVLLSMAEWVKLHRFKKDFNIINADESIEGSAAVGFSSWFLDDHNTEVLMSWSILVPNVLNSPIRRFRIGSPKDFIEGMIEDPQKFIDELHIYVVHNS
jgi:hypothetical protein